VNAKRGVGQLVRTGRQEIVDGSIAHGERADNGRYVRSQSAYCICASAIRIVDEAAEHVQQRFRWSVIDGPAVVRWLDLNSL
jgi:hypothetical protein